MRVDKAQYIEQTVNIRQFVAAQCSPFFIF